MYLSKLISILQTVKKKGGDLPVFLSSDSEGNSFGDLGIGGSFYWDKNKVILYPFNEGLQFKDLK